MNTKELLEAAKIIAKKTFSNKKEFDLKFNHEEDGCWYIDFPNWPFDHHNLMMVAGADDLCTVLSDNNKSVEVLAIPRNKPDKFWQENADIILKQGEHSLTGGSIYSVGKLRFFDKNIWLCPVTLFVFGKYPKYIYLVKKEKKIY